MFEWNEQQWQLSQYDVPKYSSLFQDINAGSCFSWHKINVELPMTELRLCGFATDLVCSRKISQDQSKAIPSIISAFRCCGRTI